MWPRPVTILTALSLLLCIATAVLLITSLVLCRPDSYGGIHPIELYRRGDPAGVSHSIYLTSRGRVALDKTTGSKTIHLDGSQMVTIQVLQHWSFLGIDFTRDTAIKTDPYGAVLPGNYGQTSTLSITLVWPLLLFGIFPIARLFFVLERRRRRILSQVDHFCPFCGYDVRATPDCCPECGTRIPVPSR